MPQTLLLTAAAVICGSNCVPVMAPQCLYGQKACCPLSSPQFEITGVPENRTEFMFSGPRFTVDGNNACLGRECQL